MPDINPSLPIVGQPNSSEEPKVVTALSQLIAAVNDVDSAQILDGAIATSDIANLAVTGAKIGVVPCVRLIHQTDSAIANASFVAHAFTAEFYDTDTMHDTAVNTTRLTAKTAGKYRFTGQIAWATNATGERAIQLRKNGTTVVAQVEQGANPSGQTMQNVSTEVDMAVNDYVELLVFQSSGAPLSSLFLADYTPVFAGSRLGA